MNEEPRADRNKTIEGIVMGAVCGTVGFLVGGVGPALLCKADSSYNGKAILAGFAGAVTFVALPKVIKGIYFAYDYYWANRKK